MPKPIITYFVLTADEVLSSESPDYHFPLLRKTVAAFIKENAAGMNQQSLHSLQVRMDNTINEIEALWLHRGEDSLAGQSYQLDAALQSLIELAAYSGRSTEAESLFSSGAEKLPDQKAPSHHEWVCPNCGKVHYDYVGTCGCGQPKPEETPAPAPHGKHPVGPNEWRCPNCGKIHYSYVGTCGCGQPKPAPAPAQTKSAPSHSNEWRCPKCGKKHYNYVGTCGCGEPKPSYAGSYIPSQPVHRSKEEQPKNEKAHTSTAFSDASHYKPIDAYKH